MEKIALFQRCMQKYDVDPREQGQFEYDGSYINCYDASNSGGFAIMKEFVRDMKERGNSLAHAVVLNDTISELRTLEENYRAITKTPINLVEVMFFREADRRMEDERIRALNRAREQRLKCEGKNISITAMDVERRLKYFFDGDQVARIKFSTIKSFKGFESDFVCLVIDEHIVGTSALELIYVGLTRARKGLYVFNCGNEAARPAISALGKVVELNGAVGQI